MPDCPEAEDIVGALGDDFLGDLLLTAHGVDRHDRALDGQKIEQFGNGGDLVGFFVHRPRTQHQFLARTPGRHQVNGAFVARPVEGAAHRLAVDGNHTRDGAARGLRPGDEAGLESLRIQGAEDQSELIVARRAVLERQEPAQKLELLLTEQRHAPSAPHNTAHSVRSKTSSGADQAAPKKPQENQASRQAQALRLPQSLSRLQISTGKGESQKPKPRYLKLIRLPFGQG